MADNVKGNYVGKFLEAIDFAFKKCNFNFVSKAEQLQAIHAAVTGNDVFVKPATGFGKPVCCIVVPLICDTGFFCSKLPLNYAVRPNGKLQKLIYMEVTQRIRMKIPGLVYKNTSVANKQ